MYEIRGSINELNIKVDDLETLILSTQDMVMHNIATVYTVAGIILALVALTGFSSIKNTVNKRFDKFYEDNNVKMIQKIKIELEREENILNSIFFTPSTLSGALVDEATPLTVSILNKSSLNLSGMLIYQGPANRILVVLPVNFKIEKDFVFSVISENIETGELQQAYLELKNNRILSKSNFPLKTKIHFGNTIIPFEEYIQKFNN